ncbi:MAG: YlmC/YmxH family sporulation protein [Bacilli bacterium]|nr:YlmC/YmxH family sporulation protein [Bacilli bacterium]
MKLSELQSKKIISVSDGKNIGSIIDAVINSNGQIEVLLLESSRGLFNISKDMDMKIYWKEIEKIGEDVILVKKEY